MSLGQSEEEVASLAVLLAPERVQQARRGKGREEAQDAPEQVVRFRVVGERPQAVRVEPREDA